MRNIIVTGATSFIGRHLIEKLLADNNNFIHAVIRRGSLRKEALSKSDNMQLIELNMEEYGSLSSTVTEPCEICFALAWDGTRGASRNDKALQQNNYKYSMECIKEVCKLGCNKIICSGSQAEYGDIAETFKEKLIMEDIESNPTTEYGIAKVQFYQKAKEYCTKRGVSIIEPRFFSIYGEDDNFQTVILAMLGDMMQDKPCKLTQCVQYWDFLYIDDAVDALVKLMEQKCDDGIYNVASGDNRRLKEFIEEMYLVTHSKSKLLYGAVPYSSQGGMVSIRPSVEKLKTQTGWYPKVSFEMGIRRVIDFLQGENRNEM